MGYEKHAEEAIGEKGRAVSVVALTGTRGDRREDSRRGKWGSREE